jgi:hypothetical protein
MSRALRPLLRVDGRETTDRMGRPVLAGTSPGSRPTSTAARPGERGLLQGEAAAEQGIAGDLFSSNHALILSSLLSPLAAVLEGLAEGGGRGVLAGGPT